MKLHTDFIYKLFNAFQINYDLQIKQTTQPSVEYPGNHWGRTDGGRKAKSRYTQGL